MLSEKEKFSFIVLSKSGESCYSHESFKTLLDSGVCSAEIQTCSCMQSPEMGLAEASQLPETDPPMLLMYAMFMVLSDLILIYFWPFYLSE